MKRNTPPQFNFQLKITLKYSSPPIWRRVVVPSNIELADLSNVLLIAMEWEGYHLHQFIHKVGIMSRYSPIYYMPASQVEDDWLGEGVDYTGVTLTDLMTEEKDKIQYEYDFGDSWLHDILLEKTLPPNPTDNTPVCLKGKGASPEEDCGGIGGYYSMLDVLNDPKHPEHESIREWMGLEEGEQYTPEDPDLEYINQELANLWKSR